MKKLFQWCRDNQGATAIEYGLIAGGIAVSLMAIIFTMGDSLVAIFQSIADRLD